LGGRTDQYVNATAMMPTITKLTTASTIFGTP